MEHKMTIEETRRILIPGRFFTKSYGEWYWEITEVSDDVVTYRYCKRGIGRTAASWGAKTGTVTFDSMDLNKLQVYRDIDLKQMVWPTPDPVAVQDPRCTIF